MNRSESQHEPLPKPLSLRSLTPFIAIALIGTLIVSAIYVFNFYGPLSDQHERWGQFGDYIGGLLNPVFGLLSFGALLIALVLQSKELHASTHELHASAQALDAQHVVLTKQSFENTYFQLLRRVGEIISEMTYGGITGRPVLAQLCSNLRSRLVNSGGAENDVKTIYRDFYNDQSAVLGHYFRTLYHVFTFVDHAPFGNKEKIVYANIARAQLSGAELFLLFYNGTTGEGAEGFKPLIERYGILKHIMAEALPYAEHRDNSALYSPTAFMSADERNAYKQDQGDSNGN